MCEDNLNRNIILVLKSTLRYVLTVRTTHWILMHNASRSLSPLQEQAPEMNACQTQTIVLVVFILDH